MNGSGLNLSCWLEVRYFMQLIVNRAVKTLKDITLLSGLVHNRSIS
jgi:hypothetical protein